MKPVTMLVALALVGCGEPDRDGDGFSGKADCDDDAANVHPGAFDAAGDAEDRDCDGADGVDADLDGHADLASGGADCDDADPEVHPGAPDPCNDRDDDCDGTVDGGDDADVWYPDRDGDRVGDDALPMVACRVPEGHVALGGDCDDDDPAVNPGASEVCDEIDNDCDGMTDGPTAEDFGWHYFDGDGDGHGDPRDAVEACEGPTPAWVRLGDDCDDADRRISPDADEVCDDVDDDCDGDVDEDTAVDAPTWYRDTDGDGHGDPARTDLSCRSPGRTWVDRAGDCDDARGDLNPDQDEQCDGDDNDCDGLVDDLDPDVSAPAWFPDVDGDGYADAYGPFVRACSAPANHVDVGGDCDDTDDRIHPGADELCGGRVDEDCDGLVDDDDPSLPDTSGTLWWPDLDGDGWGADGAQFPRCRRPSSGVLVGGDCRDDDPGVNPEATEVCGGLDEDCDGLVDDADPDVSDLGKVPFHTDADADGYGDAVSMSLACESTPGIGVDNADDCDDADPWANVDQDWFVDADADGAGEGAAAVTQCLAPVGLAPEQNGVDCAPTDPAVFPLQLEDCVDGADQNCDGLVDCDDPDCFADANCTPPCADEPLAPTTLPITVIGDTTRGGDDYTTGACGTGGNGAPDRAYWFTPPVTGTIAFDTEGATWDTTLFVVDGCGGTELTCNDDTVGLTSRVEVAATAGVPFLVIVDGFGSSSGPFELHVRE